MGDTKRKMLTHEERIAKAKAELEALEAKAVAKDVARHAIVVGQLTQLAAKRADLDSKVVTYEHELALIESRVPALLETAPALVVVQDSTEAEAQEAAV